MKKKKVKRIIKIILAILLILVIIATIDYIRKKTSDHTSVDDFVNLKEFVEYIGATYYKTTASDEEGYEGDYYISFPVDPMSESFLMATNQDKYETIILSMEEFLKYKNIRIIDESRKLVIRTSCDKEKKHVNYTVNGVTGYFKKKQAIAQANANEEEISDFKINSPELNSIINANWVRRQASLGTIDQPVSNESYYDCYIDEGYKTRVIGTKIYNIIFNENYKKDVIENIKPGMELTEVVSILGEPTYKQVHDINYCRYIGYKLNSCYVFFSDEISVYPVVEFDEEKNNQFAEAISEFEKTGSKSELLKKVTEIYPNYNELRTQVEENYSGTRINYALYGFNIILNDYYNTIIVFSNYQGKLDNNTTVEEVKLGLKSLSLFTTKLYTNSYEYEEAERLQGENPTQREE